MYRTIIGVALALTTLSFSALAQGTGPQTPTQQNPTGTPSVAATEARAKYRAACADDIQKFCANVEKAKGAKGACLDSNATQLSDACKVARAERAAAKAK